MKLDEIYINSKTEFTRRCIGDAVIRLLKNEKLERLQISEISKVAGVSRTTFYQYYTTPYSVLTDYLNMIVAEYLIENKKQNLIGKFFHHDHIVFSFDYFDKYSEFFYTIIENKLHSIAYVAINEFMTEHVQTNQKSSLYILYAYAGALLNCFLQWLEGGRKESVEEIARTLEHFVPGDGVMRSF